MAKTDALTAAPVNLEKVSEGFIGAAPEGRDADCRARIVGWWNCKCATCRKHAEANTITAAATPQRASQNEEQLT